MNPRDPLLGILVPGLVAAAILWFAWKLGSKSARREPSAPAPAAAIAVSFGTLAGFVGLNGWNTQPTESFLWMAWVFPAAALFGALEARRSNSLLLATVVRIALVATSVGLVFHKSIFLANGTIDAQRLVLFVAIPLITISVWKAIFPVLDAVTGAATLWIVATGAAALLLFANSLRYAQVGGALAGALGAVVVACLLRASASGLQGAVTPVAVILSTLVCLSLEYASPAYSPWLLVLLGLAPALGLFPRTRRPWVKLACIAIPIVIAVVLAFRTYDTSAL